MASFARNNQVLLLTRDRALIEPLRQNLRLHGFAAISISEPEAAIDALTTRPPDLVLLDWTLPITMRESVRRQKLQHGFALIVLSAPDVHASASLAAYGADALVCAPVDVRDTTGRVQTLLRRPGHEQGSMLISDDLVLDQGARQVSVRGARLPMSDVQLRLLECFMQHAGALCPRSLLLKRVWNAGTQPASRTVDVNVQRLRQLLEAAGCRHCIETVRGSGYRFLPSTQAGSHRGS